MMLVKFTHIGKNIIGKKFLFMILKHGLCLQNFHALLMRIDISNHRMV